MADLRARITELERPRDAAVALAKAEARAEAEESLRAEVRAHEHTRKVLEKTQANARTEATSLRHHFETLMHTTIEQMNRRQRPRKPGT